MVYTADLKSAARKGLRVRVPPLVPVNTNMKYFNTITQISVGMANDNPVFGDCIRLRLEDECGGMFLVLEQDTASGDVHQVRVAFDEWDNICQAVLMLKNQPLIK